MSLTLWRRRPEYMKRSSGEHLSALVRPVDQWKQIFGEQTDGSPREAAARIFGDLMLFTPTRKQNGFDEVRPAFYSDVEQLARALEAYVEFRRNQQE